MRALTVVLALAALALAACTSDGEPSPTPSATPTPDATSTLAPTSTPPLAASTPESTPTSPPGPRRTGDPALDAIIAAVEARDVDALVGMVELIQAPCRTEESTGWQPPCLVGEERGTPVSGISFTFCEGGLVRDVPAIVKDWLLGSRSFISGVDDFWASVSAGEFFERRPWGAPDTFLVFHNWRLDLADEPVDLAMYVEVRDGHIMGLGANCLSGLDDLLDGKGDEIQIGPWHDPVSDDGPRRTGDPALDAVLDTIESRDAAAVADLFVMQTQPCTLALGAGGPPKCAEGEAEGTPVEVFPVLGCEPEWHRDVTVWAERLALGSRGLFAASVPAGEERFEYGNGFGSPPSDVIVVLHEFDSVGALPGVGVHLSDGRVVSLALQCGAGEPLYELLRPADSVPNVIAGPWFEPRSDEGPRRTGDPELDAIIEAAESRDIDTLAALQRTEVVTCRGADEPSQIGSPPACADVGVPEGTELTVGWGASCEGYQSPTPRALLVNWLPRQDGLYAAASVGDGVRLVFHGTLAAGRRALELWVENGQVDLVNFGCSETPAQRVAAYEPNALLAGPWFEPETPDAEALSRLLAPIIEEVEEGNIDALVDRSPERLRSNACRFDPADARSGWQHFLSASPRFVGVYERGPGNWWLVFELDTGFGRVEFGGGALRVLFYPCARTLEDITTDGLGQPLERIELSSE